MSTLNLENNTCSYVHHLKDAAQLHSLIQKLQVTARDAGHERPLLIGFDQENGSPIQLQLYTR